MTEEAIADHGKQLLATENAVLIALRDHPNWSLNEVARDRGWVGDNEVPDKKKVLRLVRQLADDKLVEQPRKGAPWQITEKGRNVVKIP